MMSDCNEQVETMMQWLSTSATARRIDSEIGDLNPAPAPELSASRPNGDLLAGRELLTYLRYNIEFEKKWMKKELGRDYGAKELAALAEMDAPGNMEHLEEIGAEAAGQQISDAHLPKVFDL